MCDPALSSPSPPAGTTRGAIPTLRYQDAPGAIAWLEKTFGFLAHLVVPVESDDSASVDAGSEAPKIAHAQLRCGPAMIMLGSVLEDTFGALLRTPENAGGVTSCPYMVVPELKVHYERAVAAGAEIVQDYADQPYGGAAYVARDPEGHIWCFGSYDPFADEADEPDENTHGRS